MQMDAPSRHVDFDLVAALHQGQRSADKAFRLDLNDDIQRGALITHEGEVRNERGQYDCVFLRRDEKGRGLCSIYPVRPTQCRTWPFWPENLSSKRAWITAKKRTPCPGMDNGKLVPIHQIRIQRDATAV
jgi:Fe-S-cluster containining protein